MSLARDLIAASRVRLQHDDGPLSRAERRDRLQIPRASSEPAGNGA